MLPSSSTSAAPVAPTASHRRLSRSPRATPPGTATPRRPSEIRAQRLQLGDPPPRIGVELRVLDRLRHLVGDRHEQVDLVLRENPVARPCGRSAPPQDARGPGSGRPGSTRTGPRAVREPLEARIEVRLRRIMIGVRSAAATPVIPSPRRSRGRRVISSTLVLASHAGRARRSVPRTVYEARLRSELFAHLARDERQDLLQVERRVDGRDRLREEAGGDAPGRPLDPASPQRGLGASLRRARAVALNPTHSRRRDSRRTRPRRARSFRAGSEPGSRPTRPCEQNLKHEQPEDRAAPLDPRRISGAPVSGMPARAGRALRSG